MTDHASPPEPPEEAAPSDPEALALARLAAQIADEKHGTEIVVIAVGDVLAITEYFVVVGANNRRLVRTIVDDVEVGLKSWADRSPLRVEGHREQQWVLLDYGDIVVHVFLEEIRAFYEIERLYRDAPNVEWRRGDGTSACGPTV